MIAQSFHTAQRGDVALQNFDRIGPGGRRNSRLAAAHAIRWLRARTNWTHIPIERRLRAWGAPAPPREVRDEYPLTFSWCCEILNINEDKTRENGAPFRSTHSGKWFARGGLLQWREWRAQRGQKHAVYRDRPCGANRLESPAQTEPAEFTRLVSSATADQSPP
ncbi:MAG TPA: hypothetical protein VMI10_10635 [Terriglobales bacterium]|nr:hypothetical protein [Terriglobales bacterium]